MKPINWIKLLIEAKGQTKVRLIIGIDLEAKKY